MKQRLDITIQVRCTLEEKEHWMAAAKADGRTMSNWLRRQLKPRTALKPVASIEESTRESAIKWTSIGPIDDDEEWPEGESAEDMH